MTLKKDLGPPQASPEYSHDYLAQQVSKTSAGVFRTADHVTHADSDRLSAELRKLEDFFHDGEPKLRCYLSDIFCRSAYILAAWQPPMSIWPQRQTNFHFMRCFSMACAREAYASCGPISRRPTR